MNMRRIKITSPHAGAVAEPLGGDGSAGGLCQLSSFARSICHDNQVFFSPHLEVLFLEEPWMVDWM